MNSRHTHHSGMNKSTSDRQHSASSRRGFLQMATSAAGAAIIAKGLEGVVPSVSAAQVETAAKQNAAEVLIPIVDTHQHLWNLKELTLPWLSGAPEVLGKDYGPKEYAAATEGLGIAQAIYMEVDVAEQDQSKEADGLLRLCKSDSSPTVAAVISGRPNHPSFEPYIRKYAEHSEIKGVRQVLHSPSAVRGLCLQSQFVSSMKLLGKLNRSFDLCMRPSELEDGVALAKLCPETRFIVDHCGNAQPEAFLPPARRKLPLEHDADKWRHDIAALADCNNVVCKISGVIASAPSGIPFVESLAPIINHCLDEFGPDRVVFGGDWPVCLLGGSYRDWVLALREIIAGRPLSDREKLWHGNARRIYSISP